MHRPSAQSRRTELEGVVRRVAIDLVTVEVVGAFRYAGIPSILLKGPSVTRWLYPAGGQRTYVDADLLVPEAELDRAEDVLETRGFTRLGRETIRGDWPRHAHNWIHPDGTVVDLHYTVAGAGVAPVEVWEMLKVRTERMVLANSPVEILDEGARALIVALHAWKDGRLSQACKDLALALERLPGAVWDDAAVLAARLYAIDAFAGGLEREPVGRELVARLGLPPDRSTGVALRARGAPPLAVGIDWLLRTPGWRGKLGLVGRKLFPPATFLRDWTPLAERGRLGLAAAYVWRPLWVVWHAGPGFRAWLRARREARRRTGRP